MAALHVVRWPHHSWSDSRSRLSMSRPTDRQHRVGWRSCDKPGRTASTGPSPVSLITYKAGITERLHLRRSDALIAATALVNGMAVVTRNVADFASMGVTVIDPWQDNGDS